MKIPTPPALRRAVVSLLHIVTPFGATVTGLGLSAWLVGWRLGWDEFMLVAAGSAVAVVAGLLFTLGRSAFDVRLSVVPTRVEAGREDLTAVATVLITNIGGRMLVPVAFELALGPAVHPGVIPALPRGGSHEQRVDIPTVRRSVVTVGPVQSVRGDPLGLARRIVTLTGTETLFVHPRTLPIAGVTAGWIRDLEGKETNDRSDSDVAFHALRPYVAGDDRRHVHWRTTARMGGTLMVRQFVDTRRAHLGLLVSTNPAEYDDTEGFELAVSAAGSLGRSALADRQAVSTVVGGQLLRSDTLQLLLDGLSGVDLAIDRGSVLHAAAKSQRVLREASVAFVLTGGVPKLGQLSAVADQFPPSVRVVTVRCAPGGKARISSAAKTKVLDIGALDQLAPLIRTLSR